MITATLEQDSLINGAIRVIIAEHGRLWRVLDTLEHLQRQMNLQDIAPDAELISATLDYLEYFSRHIHHNGNDILLHRLLRDRLPEVEALLSRQTEDHVVGAVRISELRRLLNTCSAEYPKGRDRFSKQLSRFIFALRKHIKREEGIVVPLAREHLNESDWLQVASAQREYQDPLFGPEVHEAFAALRQRITASEKEGMAHIDVTPIRQAHM